MPRYEGMEELLQQLTTRFGQPSAGPPRVRPNPVPDTVTQTESQHYAPAIELLMRLLRDAEQFRALLDADSVRAMTPGELDDLVGLLGKVLQELWSCEVALDRVAPYE